MEFITAIVASITINKILTYGYLLGILLILRILWKLSEDTQNKFRLVDLVSNPDGTASLTRLLQLIAGITGTWVVVKYTVVHLLTFEIFGLYLAAMGLSEAWTKWVQSKKDTQ